MSNFSVSVDKADERLIRRGLKRAMEPVGEAMEDLTEFVGDRAAHHAKPHAADKGTLADTVKTSLAAGKIPLSAKVFTRSGIAKTVEEGRPAGKPPPYRRIREWLESHGITESVGIVVQRIRQRGTKGVRFMRKAAKDGEQKAPELLRKAARAMERNWKLGR